jgi:hypothetical protein
VKKKKPKCVSPLLPGGHDVKREDLVQPHRMSEDHFQPDARPMLWTSKAPMVE